MANLTCVVCGHAFELPDSKIPGPRFNVKCPSCKNVFQTSVGILREPLETGDLWQRFRPQIESLLQEQVQKMRQDLMSSFVHPVVAPPKSERPEDDHRRALICESDQNDLRQIANALTKLGYSVQHCTVTAEALARLETGFYDVITTDISLQDDPEGGYKIMSKVNSRKQDERRKMFLAVISSGMRTLGPQMAFFQGANIFIQKSELQNFEHLLREGLRYYSGIYANYFELLAQSSERL